jgi:hypothetical protein
MSGNVSGPVVHQGALDNDTANVLNQQMTGGASGVQFGGQGNLNAQTTQPGKSPAATGGDIVMQVYTLPANFFDQANRQLEIWASGSFAANGHTKECKIFFNCTTAVVGSAVTGGTAIADTGASTGNNVGWELQAIVSKYGLPGSNTQIYQEQGTVVGTTHGGCGLPGTLTATENGAILIAVTGNATTTATDILLNFFATNALN